ncbi:MAG TPA: protein kinase [Gemmataceae bacterium]|nr:protein kinase [Gemmataceae bacterium]
MKTRRMPVIDEFDEYIAAFESAYLNGSAPSPADFLPPAGDPLRARLLPELIRVDLEWSWRQGQRHRIEDYRQSFPELFAEPALCAEIAFEEYRQRCLAGDDSHPEEYQQRYQIDTSDWPRPADTETNGRKSSAIRDRDHEVAREAPSMAPDISIADPATIQLEVERVVPAQSFFPEAGGRFLGFQLLAEIGRGAFARVFLARQISLADRLVVLKLSAAPHGESQKLARLQHTNIVPIYSAHQDRAYHAVCMPYFGAVTLDRLLRRMKRSLALPKTGQELVELLSDPATSELPQNVADIAGRPEVHDQFEKLNYVDAVVWIASRLAAGLAHAHARGIVHRDLKPANILLADDGQPMLLDFNVAASTTGRVRAGGTPLYMPPEQLESFCQGEPKADVGSDLYALGIVLFELLTGQHPYSMKPRPLTDVIQEMLAERKLPPPPPRRLNPEITPAVDAIVRRLLDPDQKRRYQSARQLQEDFDAHLANQPLPHTREPSWSERLRKWRRRHSRLAVGGAVALAVGVFLLLPLTALAIRRQQIVHAEAITTMLQSREELRAAEFHLVFGQDHPGERQKGKDEARAVLDRYHVLAEADWSNRPALRRLSDAERQQFTAELGESLLLLSQREQADKAYQVSLDLNQKAEQTLGERAPATLWRQRAELLEQLGRKDEADQERNRSRGSNPVADLDLMQEASERIAAHDFAQALIPLERITQRNPQYHRAWFNAGHCYFMLGRMNESAASFSVCIALHPESPWGYYCRGLAFGRVDEFARAVADLDRAIELKPEQAGFLVNRGIYRGKLNDLAGAEADFARALELGGSPARVYLVRSRIRCDAGDSKGADRDLAEGMRHAPREEEAWIDRGLAQLDSNPNGALADLNEALKLNPRSRDGLQNKQYVLAEKLNRTKEAIAVLDTMMEYYPDWIRALGGRGVCHARLGNVKEARRDAGELYRRDRSPFGLYQQASLFAQLSRYEPKAVDEALMLLAEALQAGFTDLRLIEADLDMKPLREHPEFQRLLKLVRELNAAANKNQAGSH